MVSWINGARTTGGVRAVSWNGGLASSARAHSTSMVRRGSIFHSSRSQLWANMRRACSSCSYTGEVVGVGTSLRQVFGAFMASSSHRAVVMSGAFRYAGVGVVFSRGKYWVTVQFAG
jgi:uncharacterized protein YkwD